MGVLMVNLDSETCGGEAVLSAFSFGVYFGWVKCEGELNWYECVFNVGK